MKKIICASAILTGFAVAGSYYVDIQVSSTKVSGKSWDMAGGAPDIGFVIDGKRVHMKQRCSDTYRCTHTVSLALDKEKFYIEVYDLDINADDLIGKGECRIGKVCQIGRVTVTLKPARIVLADASVALQSELEKRLDILLVSSVIDAQDLRDVTQMLKQLQVWHRPLNEVVRKKLHKLQKKFPDLSNIIEQTDQIPMVG